MNNQLLDECSDLSVILIIKNESAKLFGCLKSIQGLKCEIIIVDSGSTDDSLAIAKKFTNKIYVHDEWKGFGVQRQIAQSYSEKEWVLMLDADERLTPDLVAEINRSIISAKYVGYIITRRNYFLNRELRHGGGVDSVLRLYKNIKGKCTDAEVHEKIIVDGSVGKLKWPMFHFSTDSLFVAINKMNQYSDLGSMKLRSKKTNVSLISAVLHGLWTFIRIYMIQLGFMDGKAGFILAVLKAEGSYYKYVKLIMTDWEIDS